MGVPQGQAPWPSCGLRPSRILSETVPGDRPASRRAECDRHRRRRDERGLPRRSVGEQTAVSDKLIEHARKTALARPTPAEGQCEFAELLYRSSRPSLALGGRTFASAVPKWVLQAVSHRFEYHITLLQGVIGATEVARCAASPRTIALLKERLVLGASRLHIGRHCGGYRGKSYERKTHMILVACLWATPEHEGVS